MWSTVLCSSLPRGQLSQPDGRTAEPYFLLYLLLNAAQESCSSTVPPHHGHSWPHTVFTSVAAVQGSFLGGSRCYTHRGRLRAGLWRRAHGTQAAAMGQTAFHGAGSSIEGMAPKALDMLFEPLLPRRNKRTRKEEGLWWLDCWNQFCVQLHPELHSQKCCTGASWCTEIRLATAR